MKRLVIIALIALAFTTGHTFAQPLGGAAYTCQDWDEIDADVQKQLITSSEEYLHLFLAEDPAPAWWRLHPKFQDALPLDAYAQVHQQARPMHKESQTPEFVTGKLVTVQEVGTNAPLIVCGSADYHDPDYMRFYAIPEENRQAVVVYSLNLGSVERRVGMRLCAYKGEYRLISCEIFPHAINGHDALYFAALGERWMKESGSALAVFSYAMADCLSGLEQQIQDGRVIITAEKLNEFRNETSGLCGIDKLGNMFSGSGLKIFSVIKQEWTDDINPMVCYITNGKLEEGNCDKEAHELLSKLKAEFPQLENHFERIAFKAFNEEPVSPNTVYDAYVTVLKMKE